MNSETKYLIGAARIFIPAVIKTKLRGRTSSNPERTPQKVQANYDAIRATIDIADFDEYVFEGDKLQNVLLDDCVVRSTPSAFRHWFAPHLKDTLQRFVSPGSIVIEFGSGDGRNLFYLKKAFPFVRFIGLELSPVSVEMSKRAARKFGLEVEFHVANIAEPLPPLPAATVCYSVHALEQMPDIFRKAVDSMLRAEKAALFYEPVGELYTKNLRGLISRARLADRHYLNGLYSYLKEKQVNIVKAERTRMGSNPLNETVEIIVSTT